MTLVYGSLHRGRTLRDLRPLVNTGPLRPGVTGREGRRGRIRGGPVASGKDEGNQSFATTSTPSTAGSVCGIAIAAPISWPNGTGTFGRAETVSDFG